MPQAGSHNPVTPLQVYTAALPLKASQPIKQTKQTARAEMLFS